jgi:hypothetical protein
MRADSVQKILEFCDEFVPGEPPEYFFDRLGQSRDYPREMKNISRGPTFGDFVTISTEGSMQEVTVARLQVQEYRLPSPPSLKCNVLRESFSVDSQNIPCAALKRRMSWVISLHHRII